MSLIAKAVELIKQIAADNSHGYDQTNRWGPDFDCSSLIIWVLEQVGIRVKSAGASYTGNMRSVFLSCGFEDVTAIVNIFTGANLQAGDILLNYKSHTAMYIGNGMIAHASLNERGTTTGGMPGDQTGGEICTRTYYNYPWDCVLRYKENITSVAPPVTSNSVSSANTSNLSQPGVYKVKAGDTLSGIAAAYGIPYQTLASYNGISDPNRIFVGQTIKIPNNEEASAKTESSKKEDAYTVQVGDTLWAISMKVYGNASRVSDIQKLNNLSSIWIYPGQKLKLP